MVTILKTTALFLNYATVSPCVTHPSLQYINLLARLLISEWNMSCRIVSSLQTHIGDLTDIKDVKPEEIWWGNLEASGSKWSHRLSLVVLQQSTQMCPSKSISLFLRSFFNVWQQSVTVHFCSCQTSPNPLPRLRFEGKTLSGKCWRGSVAQQTSKATSLALPDRCRGSSASHQHQNWSWSCQRITSRLRTSQSASNFASLSHKCQRGCHPMSMLFFQHSIST